MSFDPNKFVNPGQFADYSSYSGMGGDQQMKSLKQVAAEAMGSPSAGGVAPPQSFEEFGKQMVAPITNSFNNLSNRFNQAAQGNIFNAATGQQQTVQQQSSSQPFNYQSAVDQIDKE